MTLGDLIAQHPEAVDVLGTIGILYDWGGGGPSVPWPPPESGVDCSGLAQMVLVRCGLLSPTAPRRNAFQLANLCDPVPATAAPRFLDVAFFGHPVDHVTICLGVRDLIVGASGGGSHTHGNDPNAFVQMHRLHYRNDFVVVGRLKASIHLP